MLYQLQLFFITVTFSANLFHAWKTLLCKISFARILFLKRTLPSLKQYFILCRITFKPFDITGHKWPGQMEKLIPFHSYTNVSLQQNCTSFGPPKMSYPFFPQCHIFYQTPVSLSAYLSPSPHFNAWLRVIGISPTFECLMMSVSLLFATMTTSFNSSNSFLHKWSFNILLFILTILSRQQRDIITAPYCGHLQS